MKRALSLLLTLFMSVSILPTNVLAAAVADRDRTWVVEFASQAARDAYIAQNGGEELGGTFALTHGGEVTLSASEDVRSLTENTPVYGSAHPYEGSLDIMVTENPLINRQHYLWNYYSGWSYSFIDESYQNATGVCAGGAWKAMEQYLSDDYNLTPQDCSPIRVAVIDSGIDATHEDLANRVAAGYDAVNDKAIPEGVDSDVSKKAHGTMVAGLIAAEADNEVGITGAAYLFPVTLVPVRALDSSDKGEIANIVRAINWAVDEGKVDIINLSFGSTLSTPPAAMQSAVNRAIEAGITVVAAAGNDGKTYTPLRYNYYPAALDGVLAVGSLATATVNHCPQRASFSNYFPFDVEHWDLYKQKLFMLPGEELLTTNKDNGYDTFTKSNGLLLPVTALMMVLISFISTL